MSRQSVATFSRDSTRAVLDTACQLAGLDPAGAELIRLGQNAIYRLTSVPAVVRIARGMDYWADASKEVAVADWLAASGVPAARVWSVEQPVEADGFPVTFWHYIAGRNGAPEDVRALGDMMRRIHRLPRPAALTLPGQEPMPRSVELIKSLTW